MDLLQGIPFHVLLEIVKSMEDLHSLLHLLRASPVVSCLFHDCTLEIFDAVAQRSVPPNIQALLHTIAYVRAGKTASHGFHDSISKIGSYGVHGRGQTIAYREDQCLPAHFLRDILALTRHIQHLDYQCIYDMLQRCLTLNPSHLVDENSPENPTVPECYAHPRPPHPSMQSYKLRDSGPPSWMKVQRVYRALWPLQFFYDVQKAAGGGEFNWPSEHVRKILHMEPEVFWDRMEHKLLEELRTIKTLSKDFIQAALSRTYQNIEEKYVTAGQH